MSDAHVHPEPMSAAALTRGWLAELQPAIETRLRDFLDRKVWEAAEVDIEAENLAQRVRDMSLRPGKRLRPALAVLGFESVSDTAERSALIDAALSLELLQTHLLVQDDWMDQDEVRRGGPTIHHDLAVALGEPHLAASVAILASDTAWAYALETLASSRLPAERRIAAVQIFSRLEEEVVFGQLLDVLGTDDTEKLHRLKTAGYTVVGPLRIGAELGGANADQMAALSAYGLPLGIAFQLRDDLIGTFGDPAQTGKPAGADLRAGKRTALVTVAMRRLGEPHRVQLELVLGREDATDAEIADVTAMLEAQGVRQEVEARAKQLEDDALAAIDDAGLRPEAVQVLRGFVDLFAARTK